MRIVIFWKLKAQNVTFLLSALFDTLWVSSLARLPFTVTIKHSYGNCKM